MRRFRIVPALFALFLSAQVRAQANAGVSDERVRLPQAPGSISGVGENASVEGNHGALEYTVDFEVPEGFPGVTPDLALTYSSTGGASMVGIGWSMPSFSISRMTSKGLQRYQTDDRFVVDGFQELVQVAQSATSGTYRSRFEGSFVRYTWVDRGVGHAGFWKAEFPDGRVGYYGAEKSGVAVPSARVVVPNTAKTFSWRLVLMEDAWGHQMKLAWTRDASGTPLLERIEYLFEGALPRHSVRFTWEPRTDVLSDATPGFDLRLTQRLKDVRVFSGTAAPEQVRRYALEYEPDARAGFTTRLASVSRFGHGDVPYPVKFTFGYSKSLGGECAANCDKPFVVSMGTLGNANFALGTASLVDINGDALPDVLATDALGVHRFYQAKLDAEGRASFSTTPTVSARTGTNSPFVLGRASVQLLDVDGDGFVDLTESRLRMVLCNDGSGDWAAGASCARNVGQVPVDYAGEPAPASQQDPRFVRFFDYDNDKRIDWLRTSSGGGATTEVLVNEPGGLSTLPVDSIGAAFDEGPLQLADLNGDGLQDPVQLFASGPTLTVQYKLNLGFGHWEPSASWRTITVGGLNPTQTAVAELEDIDGDGLADVVMVTPNDVSLLLNRNGDSFAPLLTITTGSLSSGAIPNRAAGTTISYADMNGNGSADVVWFQPGGAIEYLELFPARPNLISRIENGLGSVQRFTYGSSIFEQARDAAAGRRWTNKVPNATVLVTQQDTYVTLTGSDSGGLHERVNFRYHDGFYDGVEKQFRGYETVEQEQPSDPMDAEEASLTVTGFDVGKLNPAFASHQRTRAVFSIASGAPVLVHEERSALATCAVAEVPPTASPPVVFVCDRASTTLVVERDPMNARTLEVQREYDGYGKVTTETNLGVKHLGSPESPRGCEPCVASGLFGAPCGDQCLGDEAFTTSTWVTPGPNTSGAWIIGLPSRVVSGALQTSQRVETLTFYDGPDFVGLPAGTLTRGSVTRLSRRFGPGATDLIDEVRLKLDANGNPVESIAPNGTLSGASHRRRYTYDAAGRWPTRVEAAVDGALSLRRDLAQDPAFEQLSLSSSWYPVVNGQPAATALVTRYRYDEHDRLAKVLDPSDTDATASTEYQYELANPASRIVTLRRSAATGGQDVVTADCLDGAGRSFQTRQRLSSTQWQVSGFTEYDRRGAAVREFQPYLSSTGACEPAPPQGVLFTRMTYDVMHRMTAQVEPDGAVRRSEFGPLTRSFLDEDDTDAASPSANTPLIERRDGLGRVVQVERTVSGGRTAKTRIEFDAEGRLLAVKDPGGHAHVQRSDLMGRVTEVTDVNSGVTRMTYDAAGNRVSQTDARGVVVRSAYDALDRQVAEWSEADAPGTRVSWTYDLAPGCPECTNAGSRVVKVEWNNGGTPARDHFGYDVRGRLVFEERTLDDLPLVTRHRYDAADRLIETVYPGGLSVPRAWDGASRLVALPGYVRRIDYTERDDVGAVLSSNGSKTTWEYDARRRRTRETIETADAQPIVDLRYSRSKRGDLLAIADGAGRPERARHGGTFTHDAWARLTRAVLDRDGEPEVLSFEFDDLDNLTAQRSNLGAASPAHLGALEYDGARVNAVVKAGERTAGYDAAGAMTARGSTAYQRDHFGRITRASRDGQETGAFAFGAGPNRVVKREGDSTTWYVARDFEVRDGIAVAYARLGRSRVARLESSALAASVLSDLSPATGAGTLTPTGDGTIDVADAWLAQAAAVGAVQLNGGPAPSPVKALLASAARRLLMKDVTWLHEDHLGSVVAATDERGALVAEQSFYPTGSVRSARGFVDVYGFTGQQRDSSTGLIHFQYRDLDPDTGRWTSVDPAFTELTSESALDTGEATAAYAYVANDFLGSIDPTGLAKKGPAGPKVSKAPGKKPTVALNAHAYKLLSKVAHKPGIYHVTAGDGRQYVGSAIDIANRVTDSNHTTLRTLLTAPGATFAIAYITIGKFKGSDPDKRTEGHILRHFEQQAMDSNDANPDPKKKNNMNKIRAIANGPKIARNKNEAAMFKAKIGSFTKQPGSEPRRCLSVPRRFWLPVRPRPGGRSGEHPAPRWPGW